jgi:hypothetical protein
MLVRRLLLTMALTGAIGVAAALLVVSQAFATAPPTIDSVFVTGVGSNSATFSAQIDPNLATTSWHFEYGTSAAYGSVAPVPDAHISEFFGSDQPVSWTVTGLRSGTVYHFRVFAESEGGAVYSSDRAFRTGEASAESTGQCPNALLRTGYSASLPDCRAYEMVSAVEKNGGSVSFNSTSMVAALQGGVAIYTDNVGFGDSHGSGADGLVTYRATRDANGWNSHAVTPYVTPYSSRLTIGDLYLRYSDDLSAGILGSAQAMPGVPSPEDPFGADYRQAFEPEQFSALAPTNVEVPIFSLGGSGFTYRAGSADLGHVLYATYANLTPGATGSGEKLYEWADGVERLVGVLPNGEMANSGGGIDGEPGRDIGGLASVVQPQMVSRDGSRAFFVDQAAHQLYVRTGEATLWLSQPEAGEPDPEPGPVTFQGATPDGRHVLFSSADHLVDGAPASGASLNLYIYTESPNPGSEANLALVSEKFGEVLGMSEDGSTVYFVKGSSTEGTVSIWHDGVLREMGRETPPESYHISEYARVSPDGRYLVYVSGVAPTTVTNAGASAQVYLYDAAERVVRCVSCDPSGAVTDGEATIYATYHAIAFATYSSTRTLSANDRYVFFNSQAALAPGDVNGTWDAYEYDIQTGKVHLISSGTSPDGSFFLDASGDGGEAFFATDQPLVGRDIDDLWDVYVAKVDGGSVEPPPPLAPCSGDACQGSPPTVPSGPFPGSLTFSGRGNAVPIVAKAKPRHAKAKTKAKRHRRRARHAHRHSARKHG